VLLLPSAFAILPPIQEPLPNFDRRAERQTTPGAPRWLHAPGRQLTPPTNAHPHQTVKTFIKERPALFNHDLEHTRILRDFTTPHNGLRTTIWQQQIDDIPVFDALFIAHTTKDGQLAAISSKFAQETDTEKNKPQIAESQAISLAAANLGAALGTNQIRPLAERTSTREGVKLFTAQKALKGEIETRLVWLPLDSAHLRLCWEIILTSQLRGETFQILVDAESGEILLRKCLTTYITPASYRVFEQESPTPMLPSLQTPATNQPPVTNRVLVTIDALNTNASPNGWINDGENLTRGNNVDAYLDWNSDNQPDLPRVTGTPDRVFDAPLDLTDNPWNYGDASVVQLFYWCNWMHDKLYELGFTESAGNFQMTNFGRGGFGNDALRAEALDGGDDNNANISTPPDGSPPRLQLYLFTWSNPYRDPVFDATIVLHEYTHGLSNRRVGGGIGLNELQSLGLGEGWSDFYALALLAPENADPDAAYACAAYATYHLAALRDNYYFGIRRYPYSTDLTKNPLTFKDIDPTQASSHSGIPINPVFAASAAHEVHAQGEVWCMMLWEARANLIHKYGAAGNHLLLQLVTDAMNLSPPNPSFLEARDAIIQADFIDNGGANFRELWQAFAKRGLGFSAICPDSSTTTGLREAFDVPDDLWLASTGDFVASGPRGGPFKPYSHSLLLTNLGTNTLTWTVAADERWLTISPSSGILSTDSPAITLTASINGLATLLPAGNYSNILVITDVTSGRSQTQSVALRIGGIDYFTQTLNRGIANLACQTFTFTPNNSPNFYSVCRHPASGFPTSPANSLQLALGDDRYVSVSLTNNERISIYGKRTNFFFIGSNGYITFDTGDTYMVPTREKHFRLPRVAGLFTDLNPGVGGRVSWQQLADRVAITYENVPEYGTANTNSFQIEMFYDGRIRLTYLHIDSLQALLGLSAGTGVPSDFFNSDFSQYSPCSAQLTFYLPSQATEGEGWLTNQGQICLPLPASSNVLVNLSSTHPAELQMPATITIPAGETNAAFDLNILDDGVTDGTQIVTVRGSASGYGDASATIWIHDLETANLGWVLPANILENSGNVAVVLTSSVPVAADAFVQLTSSVTARLQVPAWVVIPAGTNTTQVILHMVDNHEIDGDQTVFLTAHVQNWTDANASLDVLDDETGKLHLALPERACEFAGTLHNPGILWLDGSLQTNLTVALTSDNPEKILVPTTVTIPAGDTNASFTIAAQDNLVVDGNILVTITAGALGFDTATATILVLDDDIPPVPDNPLPFNQSSNQPQSLILSWNSGMDHGDLIQNGGFENGSLEGWTALNTGMDHWRIDSGFSKAYSGDAPVTPFFGCYSATCDSASGGPQVLYQDITIPFEAGAVTLSWAYHIHNYAPNFASNHQFRVEIRDTNNSLLRLAYATQPGQTLPQTWLEQSADLSAFRGQTVRIAFVVQDELQFLNVYLDNIQVLLSPSGPTTYEVYFGTDATNVVLLGTTTHTTWELPILSASTTYYWQLISQRAGRTTGPVWQFTTTGPGRLAWDSIPSPQRAGQPFPVRISAMPLLGPAQPVTNYSGPVTLSALLGMETALFSDSFESGYLSSWRSDGGDYVHAIATNTATRGQYCLKLEGGSGSTFDGITHLLPNTQPTHINFSIRAACNDLDAGYFAAGTPPMDLYKAIVFHLDAHGRMGIFDGSDQPLAVKYYNSNRWYNVSLALNWTNHTLAYYVDEQLVATNIAFVPNSISLISLFNSDPAQVLWDEIELLNQDYQGQIALGSSGQFSDGVWTGTLTLTNPAPNLQLSSYDATGHSGISSVFSVLQPNDLSVDVSAKAGSVGEKLRYSILIANPGPSLVKNLTLTYPPPPETQFLSASTSQGDCTNINGTIMCQLGNLDPNASVSILIDLIPSRPIVLTNTLTVQYDIADQILSQTIPTITPISPNSSRLAAYVRSRTESPWGLSANEATMDRVFGAGNWQDLRYENVDANSLFSTNTTFAYLEGSDLDAIAMEQFLGTHRAKIEQWVASGGNLFLNAAPNENDGMDLGFGAYLVFPDYSETAVAVNYTHPIFNGPFTPAGTIWTGNSFAHATISGTNVSPLIYNRSNGRTILAEQKFGTGHVIFGGMSPAVFHIPEQESTNLFANILYYGASPTLVPVSQIIVGITRTNSGLLLTWSAIAGVTYRVEYKDNIDDMHWAQLAEDVVATTSTATFEDSSEPSQQRFYRIRAIR
jgi:uncharacterized repeat protein (TIGR01451 family)